MTDIKIATSCLICGGPLPHHLPSCLAFVLVDNWQDCNSPWCTLPKRHEGACTDRKPVIIDYTNWKGRRAHRKIHPTGGLVFGTTPQHPSPCWMVPAVDAEDGRHKYFASRGIHAWMEAPL